MRNQNSRFPLYVLLVALLVGAAHTAAQEEPPVDADYARFFFQYQDTGGWWNQALRRIADDIGLTRSDVGRSFALIAGVSKYPNMGILERDLSPAREDVRMLRNYLKVNEYFDEIVVLEDADVTTENLEYFLQTYFPSRLKQFPKSRFLFAYSGHGMTSNNRGYLLRTTARNLNDRANSINLNVVRIFLNEIIDSGHHVLALINSCYAGSFLQRGFGDGRRLVPKLKGAHAIVAGGSSERAWHDPLIGDGSIFFEKTIAALKGHGDQNGDGIVSTLELALYLRLEIQAFTDQRQNPQPGDLSRNGSSGEFFFLNRQKQVSLGAAPVFDEKRATSFGVEAKQLYKEAFSLYEQSEFKAAFAKFMLSAKAGYPVGMRQVGYMLENGTGVEKDYVESTRWYRLGANAGDIISMDNLGLNLFYGRGIDVDYVEAVYWFRRAAEGGDAQAMHNLGLRYEFGQGVGEDLATARQWFERAAAGGYAKAMNKLGIFFRDGRGVTADHQMANRWFQRAADAGDTGAMVNIGLQYELGRGLDQDYVIAAQWYRRAADAGNAIAMDYLGLLYRDGKGFPRNQTEALRWFQRAATSGDAVAMLHVGEQFEAGRGSPKDISLARYWYEQAATKGNAIAMRNLGTMYRDGNGVTPDAVKAVEWYRRSAEAGNTDAMNKLGIQYYRGEGVAQDDEQALLWYRRAAEAGHGSAMHNVGRSYERGEGVKQDLTEAIRWYRMAAARDIQPAKEKLKKLGVAAN